jgi:Peptidase family M23
MDRRKGIWVLLSLAGALAFAMAEQQDAYTPVVASPLNAQIGAFLGSDGRYHADYELLLSNTSATPATLQKVEVLDVSKPDVVLKAYSGAELLSRLRVLSNVPVKTGEIEFSGTRLLLIDLVFSSRADVPQSLEHRFQLLGASAPSRSAGDAEPRSYIIAPVALTRAVREISPPLDGKNWVALNGCCEVESAAHRTSSLACNGKIYYAQRFAIDWMRLDDAGFFAQGEASEVKNYADYGANILAVADGKVVDLLNSLEDQVPGQLPDRKTITLANVDGNHVVLDLGDGVFAFYGHMQKNSVTVDLGQRVHRGQVLGKLGNTGNTSAPHLHFHLMDGPSVLGSNGIPYVIDRFAIAGQISNDQFAEKELAGNFRKAINTATSPRHAEFPLDNAIVDFTPE